MAGVVGTVGVVACVVDPRVGAVVGRAVGVVVGRAVGAVVGAVVGRAAGIVVGRAIGAVVGAMVGVMLGTAVGAVVVGKTVDAPFVTAPVVPSCRIENTSMPEMVGFSASPRRSTTLIDDSL